jgi:enamine deaminase RidA (YjgF/YER057c/UK114 family)
MADFERAYSGAPWEDQVGYCRALRAGPQVFVTGTAPVAEDGSVFAPGDHEAQAERCLLLIERALQQLGLDRSVLVRTRMFVTEIDHWAAYGRAHKAFFGAHHPTTTMVEVSALIAPGMTIEIEADGYVP